ncbi:MAG TPA: ribonuclease III [Anaerolineae bacterium]|jgi:ribonuclease-3|nr:ribonuclease III [Anaerolineae bacterium]
MSSNLDQLRKTIGIEFQDETLLQQALVHRSFLNENPDFALRSNERLEYLGDALLDFIVGDYLYQRYPEMDEGELTGLRAGIINGTGLARLARTLDLGRYVYLSRGEDERGGRERLGLLSDVFEALVAAIYLDRGLGTAREFVVSLVEREVVRIVEGGLERDYKSRLQEWTQRELGMAPSYRTVMEHGPDHAKEFTVEVLVGEAVYGTGRGTSKQAAEQRAAGEALEALLRKRG